MQFKYPELLYALLLLLIPIIVHLFQLRRFKEVSFTNVAFLKELTLQTRKSSQLKKWLTLLTRLLLLAFTILAFAQPFTSQNDSYDKERETVVYLDNSFSMQAKGAKGELLKRAIQDIISDFPEDEEFTLVTNTETFRNTTIKAIKNDLLQLRYSTNQIGYDALQLKASKLFNSGKDSVKNFIVISDFQKKEDPFELLENLDMIMHIVQLEPININNVFISGVSIENVNTNTISIGVKVENTGNPIEDLSISLYNDEELLAKSSITAGDLAQAKFDLPINQEINGRLSINDNQLEFDNEFYFNLNVPEKIKVLSIGEGDDSFLKRVFTEDEFDYSSYKPERLNYSEIVSQNIVVMNELESVPNSLITALHNYTDNGGYLIIIPSIKASLTAYNQLLKKYNSTVFDAPLLQGKRITKINYSHPIYMGVFDKRVDNFQYPKVENHFAVDTPIDASLLEYEDGKPFLLKNNNAYIFTASLDRANSNFKNSPLIVPTLYNIARQSLKLPNLYYTVGEINIFDVNVSLQQDNVLRLAAGDVQIIPQQQPFASKTRLTTREQPSVAAIYDVLFNDNRVQRVSYNYNRSESTLIFQDMSPYSEFRADSIDQVITNIKSDVEINELWKWFVIFALIFLAMEMLILKYIK